MMLVEHDVEADVVAGLIFVVVAMKQIGGDARVAFAIGQDDAQRPGMIVPGWVIGLFAELIDSHGLSCFALTASWRPGMELCSLYFHELQYLFGKCSRLLVMRKMAGACDGFEPRAGNHRAISP